MGKPARIEGEAAIVLRHKAVTLYSECENYSHVAAQLGTSRDFVMTWVRRSKLTKGGLLVDAKRSGRPRKLTPEKTQELVDLVGDQSKELYCAQDYQTAVTAKGVSLTTFKRALRTSGAYKAPRGKRVLTDKHKEARYKFAKKYHTRGLSRNTMWTDSTYIVCGQGRKRWVLSGQTNETTQYRKPSKVHMYAAISYNHKSDVYFGTGTTGQVPYKKGARGVRAEEYQEEVVKKLFLPASKEWFKGEKWQFMQDGASAHTARSTKQLLRDLVEGWIKDFPANSCDLNPIEHVWAELKRRLRGKRFATMAEFKAGVRLAWASIPQSFIRRQVGSMRRRLRAVAQAKGGCTRY